MDTDASPGAHAAEGEGAASAPPAGDHGAEPRGLSEPSDGGGDAAPPPVPSTTVASVERMPSMATSSEGEQQVDQVLPQLPAAAAAEQQQHLQPAAAAVVASVAHDFASLAAALQQAQRQGSLLQAQQQARLQQQHAPPLPAAAKGGGRSPVLIDSKERLRWSPLLHRAFCEAVEELGGSAFAKVRAEIHELELQQA